MNELQQMTTISTADIPIFICSFFAYMIYRLIMVKYVLKKIGTLLNVKFPIKFVHRAFDMIHYISDTILGTLALAQRPYGHCFYYAGDCKDFMWQNPNGFELTVFEKIYYIVFFTYYSVDVFFVYTTREPYLMILHHFVTLSEIVHCVYLQSPVVGLSIMLLHDITDTPLYMGKVLLYCRSKYLKDYCLVIFGISCTYFRIINYPMIVYNVFQVGYGTLIHPTVYYIEESFLVVLYLMHVYWEYKIFTNVVEVFRGKPIHDNRSD